MSLSDPTILLDDDSDSDNDLATLINYNSGVVSQDRRPISTTVVSPWVSRSSSTSTATTTPSTFSSATVSTSTTNNISNKRTATQVTKKTKPAKKKKVPKAQQPHCIIWVCTHGKGQSSNWTQNKLKIVGVYPTLDAAKQGKLQVMSQYEQCGHGDILVGHRWDDEIDLIIRPANMTFGQDE